MGKNWNFYEERLSKQAEITPFKATPKRVAARETPQDKARIEAEVAERLDACSPSPEDVQELSAVEKAMRRNAPDLAGAPEEEIVAAEASQRAHLDAKWPRPRVMALVVVALVMWLHPASTIRLFVCAIFLFLVAAIATGPERARDGTFFLVRRVLRYWKVELVVAKRLIGTLGKSSASQGETAE